MEMPGGIKNKRLSEDSSSSDSSVSRDSVNSEESSGSAPRQKDYSPEELLSMTEEEHSQWLESFSEVAGRYTDDDPCFKYDEEDITPPIVLGYSPRVHNRQGERGGGHNRNFGYNNRGRGGDFRQRGGYGGGGGGGRGGYHHHGGQQRHDYRGGGGYRDQYRDDRNPHRETQGYQHHHRQPYSNQQQHRGNHQGGNDHHRHNQQQQQQHGVKRVAPADEAQYEKRFADEIRQSQSRAPPQLHQHQNPNLSDSD